MDYSRGTKKLKMLLKTLIKGFYFREGGIKKMSIHKNALNSRENCFNRINEEGAFSVKEINDIGLGCESKIKVTCTNCNNEVIITRKRAYKHSCPICGEFESSNEYLINKILKDNDIKFVREYRIHSFDLIQKIDFYIPALNLGIEHQGNQHYNKNNGFYDEDLVKRDRLKFVSCFKIGIGLVYTYENEGLLFNQLYNVFLPYGVHLKRCIDTEYPPAKKQLNFIKENQNKSISWYTRKLGYGEKTFNRYLKMCGFIGLAECAVYMRWENIPDEDFLDYLSHNGLRRTASYYDKTVKTVTTHMNNLGYKKLYELQLERKTIIDAFDKKYILDLIVSEKGLLGASKKLGFPKYVLEHYLPSLGYKNYQEVVKLYIKGIKKYEYI